MDKRLIRDRLRLVGAVFFIWLYIPHLLFFYLKKDVKDAVVCDLRRMRHQVSLSLSSVLLLIYFLHNNRFFRTLFYYRIGPVLSQFIKGYCPPDRYFIISYQTQIKKGFSFAHPFSTIINAESIGEGFHCVHSTTLGAKEDGSRPIVGNNVVLGANVSIIGGVKIGDNVTIGAGSVVVKDIPSNCIAAGNPARVIRYKQ